MFNIAEIADKIRQARIGKNLTQMNVADALGVTYQAVSNWERGNSMPDIGKLGDLSSLLEITLEDLLGHTTASEHIQKLMDDKEYEDIQISLPELADLSPLLPPVVVQELALRVQASAIEELVSIAPFISQETLEQLAKKLKAESLSELSMIAPFIGKDALEHMAAGLKAESLSELSSLAPFISRDALDRMAQGLKAESLSELSMIAPFMSTETLDRLLQ